MRIALLHPTYWPEVRRGSERVVHDVAVGLAQRGHDITVLTTHDAARRVGEEEGFTVQRSRRPPYMRALRWYEDHIASAPGAGLALRGGGFDVAHAFSPAAAWTAAQARTRLGGPPFVTSLHVIPTREWLVERRYRMQMLEKVLAASAATTATSEASADALRRYLLVEPEVVPGGIELAPFTRVSPAGERPVLFCAASLAEPRRRRELLLEGFALLREKRPEAELQLLRPVDPMVFSWEPPSRPEGVGWVEASDSEALAGLYAGAVATVMAAVDEGHAIPAVESLAAGTPVVGARSGALPELITGDALGRLFEPDDAGSLAEALAEALDLGSDEAAVRARRQATERFDLGMGLDAFERLYARASG